MFILPTKCWPTCTIRSQTATQNFTGHTDNDRCNIWDLEAAAIPRRVKVQHMKGIGNILTGLVSRLKGVSIYHAVDPDDHQQEFSTPFEPLPSV